MNEKIEILGVNISLQTEKNLLVTLHTLFTHPEKGGGGYVIVTPNPEFLLLAQSDSQFRNDLNHAHIAIADGVGLRYAAFFLGKPVPPRITGIDFLRKILWKAEEMKQKVLLIAAEDGLSTKKDIDATLKKKYPDLCFVSILWLSEHVMISKQDHLKRKEREQAETENDKQKFDDIKKKISFIKEFQPDIIFVGLGQKIQERWIFQYKDIFPYTKLFMGVGGSFDFLTKNQKRAPWCLRFLGLEWLWRLFLQPKRWKRIWSAVIIFPISIVRFKFFGYNKWC